MLYVRNARACKKKKKNGRETQSTNKLPTPLKQLMDDNLLDVCKCTSKINVETIFVFYSERG